MSRRFARLGAWSVSLLLAAAVNARAQAPMSASLARVLAEAAADYRTGNPVWFVAATAFPHNIMGAFPEERSARRAAGDSSGYDVFGPYVTQPDARDSSVSVVRVVLFVRHGDSTVQVSIDPRQVDALFFSPSAFDKFVVPYYTRVYGAEWASGLRTILPLGGTCHIQGSKICQIRPPLGLQGPPRVEPVTVPWSPPDPRVHSQ